MFDAVRSLGDAVEKLRASEEPVDVVELRRCIDALEFLWLRAVRAYDRSDEWQAEGFVSAGSALRAKCHLRPGVASATVQLARKLERLPETSAAFGVGEISRQHAAVIADACTPEREAAIVDLEPQLVDAARVAHPRQLHAIVRRVTDALDGDGGGASDEVQYQRRRLHLSRTLDGMVAVDGLLDPETGEAALTALGGLMEADYAAGDQRTRAQRRADAFGRLCHLALDNRLVGTSRGARPHISVIVDLAELEGRGHRDLVAQVRADAAYVGRLSQATLERLTCDCDISRIITDGPSQVLDVGRATRTAPPAIWKALLTRDRHCQGNGCDAPPAWCKAHHIQHWTKGGATSLENPSIEKSHPSRSSRTAWKPRGYRCLRSSERRRRQRLLPDQLGP
jgi:Domain of unknown function (DUF222)